MRRQQRRTNLQSEPVDVNWAKVEEVLAQTKSPARSVHRPKRYASAHHWMDWLTADPWPSTSSGRAAPRVSFFVPSEFGLATQQGLESTQPVVSSGPQDIIRSELSKIEEVAYVRVDWLDETVQEVWIVISVDDGNDALLETVLDAVFEAERTLYEVLGDASAVNFHTVLTEDIDPDNLPGRFTIFRR